MFPYEFYKVLHFAGLFLTMMALGGLSLHVINGGTRENMEARRFVMILHGVGLFFVLLAGFGLYARRFQGMPFPGWIYAKLVIWLLLGAAPAVILRAKGAARAIFFVTLVLAATAAFFATYKPMQSVTISQPEAAPAESN